MLTGSTTFHTAESWAPLCLPKFNSKGFLHAYICYIEQDISVVMISTDKDRFFELSDWKSAIVEVSMFCPEKSNKILMHEIIDDAETKHFGSNYKSIQ